MGESVRIGVIGAGKIGLQHCRTLAQHPGVELVAVADLSQEHAERAAALARGATSTTDHASLLADPSIRAVVIAATSDVHVTLISEAARAGKDVFCEKPLALTLEDADAVLRVVDECGVKLQVGFQRRFDPAYCEAQRAIAAGELGEVELIVGTTRDPKPASVEYLRGSGSLFVDMSIHDYDSVRFLTGLEVEEVFTWGEVLYQDGEGEAFVDTAVTTLKLASGALATITNSRRAVYGYEVGIEVMGSKGKVAVGQEQETLVRHYGEQGVSHDYVAWYWDRFRDAYAQELAHFVRCAAAGRAPDSSGADARAALAIALAAGRSWREGRPVRV
ncbi:MAG: inositol 2-dehydrogenase [Dehalococcoidia bacterium]